jgi:putative glutamine amidotransferase
LLLKKVFSLYNIIINKKILKMKKSIIGILLDYSTKKINDGGYANFPWYALRTHYANAISNSGGIPMLIPYEYENIKDYLEICDGLLLPGGDIDIHPSLYGEEISVKKINLDASHIRAEFEFKILNEALNRKTPILAICAGFQALNVLLGGSLYQDIAEQTNINLPHTKNIHPISVTKGSLLNKITGKAEYIVNSFHHQTVKSLGKNLKASAISPDGLIEAIELDSHPFCIGVEWHPEFIDTDEDKKLFQAFVLAAKP